VNENKIVRMKKEIYGIEEWREKRRVKKDSKKDKRGKKIPVRQKLTKKKDVNIGGEKGQKGGNRGNLRHKKNKSQKEEQVKIGSGGAKGGKKEGEHGLESLINQKGTGGKAEE